ncbi:uncharacterized protein LOC124441628 [Xenia sp. Carnegie-2017]|uniref:uncharacterized protein LOC124441628 n=1 Tax=Xenia sp. Carnegie-2017 TaxID=2897299 RepID=UPI001F04805B|nr:uncharacterized protein LOC124441628 [Xenia sp. Carnegie-2017]
MSQGQLSQHGIEKYLLQHQCPTCLGYYSRADIEAHADMCAERWIDPIGKLSDDNQNNLENTLIAEEEIGQPTVATMQEVVHLIQDNVNRLSTNRVTIRRRLAFADYVDARKRKWFAEGGNLKICFAGEPSIDGGGPRREFFTDVLQHIKSTLFDANGYPLFSARALANEDFMVAGELISSSLAQGGPAPCFLAKNVFNYVAEGVNSIQANNWLELVHDANFKDEIDKLVKCESDEELRTLLCSDDMMNILQSIGYRGVPSKEKLASRDNIIRSIVIAGIGHMLAMMDQLKTGLTLFGVLQQIQHHRR